MTSYHWYTSGSVVHENDIFSPFLSLFFLLPRLAKMLFKILEKLIHSNSLIFLSMYFFLQKQKSSKSTSKFILSVFPNKIIIEGYIFADIRFKIAQKCCMLSIGSVVCIYYSKGASLRIWKLRWDYFWPQDLISVSMNLKILKAPLFV